MNSLPNAEYSLKKMGYFSSFLMAIITLVTFGMAIIAVPISGEFCLKDCIEYPYNDSLLHYPKDFLWMYPAMLLVILYIVYMVCIHAISTQNKKIFSRIASGFALISSAILLSCYFIQVKVVPASLINDETQGIALLTQYNPHGVFIAMEELGYLLMSLSFLFIAPVFVGKLRIYLFIRWIFIISFILVLGSLIMISINYGLQRDDRFEIIVITITWLVLIVNGILTGMVFRKSLKTKEL